MPARFDLDLFARSPHAVAQLVSEAALFSFMDRGVFLPSSCSVYFRDLEGRPRIVAGGRELAPGQCHELLIFRVAALPLDYAVDQLVSRDGYAVRAEISLAVSLVPDRLELEAFRRRVLGSRNQLDLPGLHGHCQECVRAAAASFAAGLDAADLVDSRQWSSFDSVLADHFQPVGFESGLQLEKQPRAVFASSAYEQAAREAAEARRRLQRSEAAETRQRHAADLKRKRLEDVAGLLARLDDLARQHGESDRAALLRHFDPAQRDELYHGLLTGRESSSLPPLILAVAGDELLWFEPARAASPSRRRTVSTTLGALRSVRTARQDDRELLLIGARGGVLLFDPESNAVTAYAFRDAPTLRGGVNAAVLHAGRLYATHSEMGLCGWDLSNTESHHPYLEDVTFGCQSVRDLQADDDGRLWLAADSRVIGWRPEVDAPQTVLDAGDHVTALLAAGGDIFAGLKNGAVLHWAEGSPDHCEAIRPQGAAAVHSLAHHPGGGVPRLLIADNGPHLALYVIDDHHRGEYRCNERVRWGWAADDLLCGVNDRRDQILLWNIADPQQPMARIPVARLCGHSIQDVALIPHG